LLVAIILAGVVYDKQAPDGFNAWSRHQLLKTNEHWTILRSY